MLTLTATISDTDITVSPSRSARVVVNVFIVEDDAHLLKKLVSGSVDWGDGSIPEVIPVQEAPPPGINIPEFSKSLPPGIFNVAVTARNYREPVEDTKTTMFTVTVNSGASSVVQETGTVFGPILPRDTGFPNTEQWNLNTGKDIRILESSIKMLLTTEAGERVMEPTYGTNIRRVIFTEDIRLAQNLVTNEITTAISTWEPRVTMSSLRLNRSADGRSATAIVDLISNLSNQPFQVNLEFST